MSKKEVLKHNICKNSVLILLLLLCIFSKSRGQNLKHFTNGDINLYYEEFGSGPALYVFSGGPGEAPEHPYLQIIDSLKSYYTCVLLHQRGSGKSMHMPIDEKTITIKNYLHDIELLQKQRNDKEITVLGVSWGGLLAMNYAVIHPESVSNIILVCSSPPSYKLWDVLYDNQYARRSQSELDSMEFLQKIFSVKTEKELDSLKRVDPLSKEIVAYKAFIALHIRAMYYDKNKISQTHFDTLFNNFNFQPIPFIDKDVIETKWDITEELQKLEIPALIIYGRQDDQGESTFYLQKESLKYSETHVIEKCGHEILEEQPTVFFKILMDYVKKSRT